MLFACTEGNIEAGALIHDPRFATRLTAHFGALISAGLLRRTRAGADT